jgi:hypothetical protein
VHAHSRNADSTCLLCAWMGVQQMHKALNDNTYVPVLVRRVFDNRVFVTFTKAIVRS